MFVNTIPVSLNFRLAFVRCCYTAHSHVQQWLRSFTDYPQQTFPTFLILFIYLFQSPVFFSFRCYVHWVGECDLGGKRLSAMHPGTHSGRPKIPYPRCLFTSVQKKGPQLLPTAVSSLQLTIPPPPIYSRFYGNTQLLRSRICQVNSRRVALLKICTSFRYSISRGYVLWRDSFEESITRNDPPRFIFL